MLSFKNSVTIFQKSFRKLDILRNTRRLLSLQSPLNVCILGIETSCDDTGCAIVDDKKTILGEALHSQHLVHLRNGGIIPPVAQDLHRENIESVVDEALSNAHLNMRDIDAVAVTVEPGLPLSLRIGMMYAKHIAKEHNKPLIPIHHMKAHALTVRMEHDVTFPFLVLLISGGHCLLAIANDVDDFVLLGESLDDAPGEAFDKIARRLKLKNIPEYSQLSGGQAIELAATKSTNPTSIKLPLVMTQYRDCNFSMTGLKNSALKHILDIEKEHNVMGDGVIPVVHDFCAAFQEAITRHICHRTKRAMEYIERKQILQDRKQLIVSGGVACNNFMYETLKDLSEEMKYEIYRPSPKLCTDNGVMIAWNGMEKWMKQIDIVTDYKTVDFKSASQIGRNCTNEVKQANLQTKPFKLKSIT